MSKTIDELEMIRASLHAIHTQVGIAISQVGNVLERERAEAAPPPRKTPPRTFGDSTSRKE